MDTGDNHQLHEKVEDAIEAIPSYVDYSPSVSGSIQHVSSSVESSLDMLSVEESGYNSLVLPANDTAAVTCYSMNHMKRGKILIICNSKFQENLKLNDRGGCAKDIEALKDTFMRTMCLECTYLENLTASKMFQAVLKVSREDYSDYGCLMVAFLSYGILGEVYGTDERVKIENLVAPMKTCQSLVGKPKIVIIQVCRDSKQDPGVSFAHDGKEKVTNPKTPLILPTEADFLYAYSTADGFVAVNDPYRGSWFIQALCAEFKQNYSKLEVMQMLTRVCHKIAYEHASRPDTPPRPDTHGVGQVSSVTTTLTKALYFDSRRLTGSS